MLRPYESTAQVNISWASNLGRLTTKYGISVRQQIGEYTEQVIDLEVDGPGILGAGALSLGTLKRGLDLVLAVFDLQDCDLVVQLTRDRTIADLNSRFLGFRGPTNVLSFPEPMETRGQNLGQICVSVETMFREALLYGQEPVEHLFRLLAHGVLHLAGHEHGPRMQELTEQAVQAIHGWSEKDLLLAF